ncbi:MAG: hypothetical protein GY716_00175 [bacterium]|nr:hypothetical protein [bacterium]
MLAHEFTTWWGGFREELRKPGDPHDRARTLRMRLSTLDVGDRRRFTRDVLGHLLRERAYGVSLFLLEGVTDESCLRDIAENLLPLPGLQSEDEESHLADLIRVLAAVNDTSLMDPVDAYLLEREIEAHWASVPWALWPHHKQTFADAWLRFFLAVAADEWKDTLVIKSFLIEPAAIRIVRARLEPASPDTWNALREALLRQAGLVRWLSDDERAALERALA